MKLLFEWIPCHIRPRRWMAFAFYSIERDKSLFIAFPLNLLAALIWWLQDRWARKANAPSWIEQEVRRRLAYEHRTFHR